MRARRAKRKIIICSVGEKPYCSTVAPWNHRRKSLTEILVTDYSLPHINTTIKVYGLSREGCASSYHPGEHMKNLRAVAGDRAFLSKIGPLCGAVDEWFSVRDGEPFVCVFACREGRHRSVAASRLWTELCRRSGFAVDGPHHLCQWNWWGCDGTCPECDVAAPSKKAFFDNFVVNLDHLDCPW